MYTQITLVIINVYTCMVQAFYYTVRVLPSVCPVSILTVTHQGAACDEASVNIGLTIRGPRRLTRPLMLLRNYALTH